MERDLLFKALDHLQASDCVPGDGMEQAHDICQQFEGVAEFDWIHALVHRIEGDDANAMYWYRRAGKTRHPGTASEECRHIRDALRDI